VRRITKKYMNRKKTHIIMQKPNSINEEMVKIIILYTMAKNGGSHNCEEMYNYSHLPKDP
jgi:hypothetical protein